MHRAKEFGLKASGVDYDLDAVVDQPAPGQLRVEQARNPGAIERCVGCPRREVADRLTGLDLPQTVFHRQGRQLVDIVGRPLTLVEGIVALLDPVGLEHPPAGSYPGPASPVPVSALNRLPTSEMPHLVGYWRRN